MLTSAEQADRAAAGLHAHWRTQCGYVAGGEVAERHGLLVTATRLADESLNVAFAPGAVDGPAAAVAWFESWFRSRGLRPGIELRVGRHPELARLLAARGYAVVVRRPAMTLHPVALPETAVPGVRVARVTDEAGLAAFRAVQAEAFDLTPEVADGFLPWRAVEAPGMTFLVAYDGGEPCATAAATVSEHGVGIVGVATREPYRRRGIGRLVTVATAEAGSAAGAGLAWLYPTDMARRMYERLGFRTLDDHAEVWVAPRSPHPAPR